MTEVPTAGLATEPRLPEPRGEASAFVVECLVRPAGAVGPGPRPSADEALGGDDFHLALYTLYELSYRSFAAVDDRWEWEPSLVAFRQRLERAFEARLREEVPRRHRPSPRDMDLKLREIVDSDEGPSLSRHLESRATLEQFEEFVVHRSAYQLKEADPHSWVLPRLDGKPKAALVEIQADEYGAGVADRMHASMFRDTMEALGLDGSYGAYLSCLPGVTLATVNLMSLCGLNRRLRGACMGHLAVFEMASSLPNRRYANGLRRLGFGSEATLFYDEHVEADSVHENIAAKDLAGGLAGERPELAGDILFGAEALVMLDRPFSEHLLAAWESGRSSLIGGAP